MRRHRGDKRRLLEDDGWSRGDTIASVVLVIIILFLLISTCPADLIRSRTAANQASAVGNLRTINTSESTYAGTYKAGYSPTLAALGPPPGGAQPSASAAALIDSVLAGGKKRAYSFTYTPGPKDAKGHVESYTVVARPLIYGKDANDSYFTDSSGIIRMTSEDRPATAKDPPVGG